MSVLDFRYIASRQCLLNCPSCYLKDEQYMKDSKGESNGPAKWLDYKEIILNHYLNVPQKTESAAINYTSDLFDIYHRLLETKAQLNSYNILTDVKTYLGDQFFDLLKPFEYKMDKIGKILNGKLPKSAFLSFKSASDYELENFDIVEETAQEEEIELVSYSWIYGLDNKKMFPRLMKLMQEKKINLTLMFKKPMVFHPSIVEAFRSLMKMFPTQLTLDLCVYKAIDGHDCTSRKTHPKYADVYTLIADEGWFPCTYTTNKCYMQMSDNKSLPGIITGKKLMEDLNGR